MSTVEDRLTSALAARADQVQPEDLRPAHVPERPATVTWLRRPATYVAAAAACAAVIAAPFLVDAGDDGVEPVPAPAPSIVPTKLPAQADVGRDWPIEFPSDPIDVDGDGLRDSLRLRQEPGEPLVGPRVRIEVDLSSTGEAVFGLFPSADMFVNVAYVADLDGDGDRELVVFRDGGVPHVVLTLREGQLVEVEQPDDPPLVTGIVPAGGAEGRDARVWTKRGALYSYLSVDSFPGGELLDIPLVYPVEVTQWSLVEGALVPRSREEECIDNSSTDPMTYDGLPIPCAE